MEHCSHSMRWAVTRAPLLGTFGLIVLLATVAAGCASSERTPPAPSSPGATPVASRDLTPMVVSPQVTAQPSPPEESQSQPVSSRTEASTGPELLEAVVRCQQSAFITGNTDCFGDLILRAGPDQVLTAVVAGIEAGEIDSSTDTHSLAHEIGRQTARVFGIGGEAFLRCSIVFNYGCQHGFFEQALASSANATDAAVSICADLVSTESTKTVFYCYHGVGHGVMMASAYDLDLALEVCDSLGDAMASDGCWQGVFMENVNSVMRGEAREGVFLDSDPLTPCNKVADRHKWECYINHAGRLITLFDLSVSDSSHACLEAAPRFILACIQSLGLMVSNPAWQLTLAGTSSRGRNIETTLELCGQFPTDYRRDCLIGAVDNIMNFDGVVLDRALRFCRAVDDPYKESCYGRIGMAIGVQVIEPKGRLALCREVDSAYRSSCVQAAGIEFVDGEAVVPRAGSPGVSSAAAAHTPGPSTPVPYAVATSGNSQELDGEQAAAGGGSRVEVRYVERTFVPSTVTIRPGDTVVWTNQGDDLMWPASDAHPTHQEYPGFDSQRPLNDGASWSFTFEREGVWGYHNHMAPRALGTVIVGE